MKQKTIKRIMSIMLAMVMLIGLMPTAPVPVLAEEEQEIYGYDPYYEHGYFLGGRGQWEGGTWIREVYDWDDMDQVFELLDSSYMNNYGYMTIKLMADLSMTTRVVADDARNMKEYSIEYGRNNVVFDFNGHTLSATDDIFTTTNPEYPLESFIGLYVGGGSVLTFTDSVGEGGINFYSSRAIDSSLAALHVYTTGVRGASDAEDPNSYPAKVIFNGGTYEMTSKINEFNYGTLYDEFAFRGTVIADYVDVEINDGTFIANSEGVYSSDQDMCARELTAFGTVISDWENFPDESNPKYGEVIPYEETGRTVINGGKFISDGYAIHHFDNCNIYQMNGLTDSKVQTLDSHFHVNYPTINGGYFEGQMGFTGLTYTYSEGNSDLNSRPASEIIPETAMFIGVDGDGDKTTEITDWDWDDLHDMQQCFVISDKAFKFNVTPEGEGNPAKLVRNIKQTDTFEISWTVPTYLEGEVLCQPTITITRPNSNIEPKTYTKSNVTLDYSYYPNDVNVSCRLYVLAGGVGGESVYFEQNYNVDVKRIYTASDACIKCYAAGEDGWNEIVEGEDCSFKIYPKDYYELTNSEALKVYVNDILITPDANGVYTVENVTEDLTIYTDGSAFTGYSNLIISANGKTMTEKLYVGDTYTFKTLAEFGATVPTGSTFTGWKLGGKTYQPGETFTVKGTGEIAVNAAFTGLYNITVENGKAYADEAHTKPISAAAENTVIYIVADEAPEGKVFSYWNRTFATVGGHGWFDDSESAETTFTVYDSDVVLTPIYEVLVDEIVIDGMTKPVAGVAIDNSDYSYKWGCSVPADAGYTLGICYWYDITDGEPEFAMSSGDVFQIGHTYRFKARIHLKADHIYPANAEDISVVLSDIDAEDYQWTINEIGYSSATIYYEFECERVMPDTSIERPAGSGTADDPFKISTIGELYWFTGFTNNYVAVGEEFEVERNEACAILMNDIIVNPELLDSYVLNANSSLLADWTPICGSEDSPYCGTFDGQGYSISGLYYNTPGYQYDAYGFIAYMGEGGAVKDLTVKDTYFYIKYTSHFTPYVAGIAAYSSNATNKIENCHFDGVAGGDSSNKGCVAGGITAVTGGKIQNCTVKGRVLGYDSYVGYGKAGGIAGHAYSTAAISDCINYAEVLCWDSGSAQGTAGGIVGYLYGTVKDCSNRGVINGYDRGNNNNAGGIVGWASGTAEQKAVISRCFNMAYFSGSGIVDYISKGYVTVKNCYNAGSVTIGIAGITNGAGISITYCHDVGYTGNPIGGYSSEDDTEIDHCYYIDRVSYDTDRNPMTDAMLAEEFADGTVLALLNNGHWTQGEGDEYPVLGEIPGVTISGTVTSFNSDTDNITIELFAEGSASAAYTATVKGNSAEYAIEGVAEGTYTMKVSKNNHVTREYTIEVGTEDLIQDAKIHLKGDINGDGKITIVDANRANLHFKNKSILSGYELLCADVNGDGKVTIVDVNRMNLHFKNKNKLW